MIADYHVHTNFSGDSDADPHQMVNRAIESGMRSLCITDHMDTDSVDKEFILDTDRYIPYMLRLKEEYRGRLDLRIGVEIGMQTCLGEKHEGYIKKYPFDFVIGSLHLVNGIDPYYPEAFEGRSDGEVYRDYLESLLENIKVFRGFQVMGHLDYVVRYGKRKAEEYSYRKYREIIDEILRELIRTDRGIEINTAGLYKGLGFVHPHYDIIERYKTLGGELITLGSDAHRPEDLGYGFRETRDFLKNCGFRYYMEFNNRVPEFIQL